MDDDLLKLTRDELIAEGVCDSNWLSSSVASPGRGCSVPIGDSGSCKAMVFWLAGRAIGAIRAIG
jgi:hypothetical protein